MGSNQGGEKKSDALLTLYGTDKDGTSLADIIMTFVSSSNIRSSISSSSSKRH